MADKTFATVVLRKEVPDQATAKLMYAIVKQRMEDRPDILVSGSSSTTFIDEE